jgi:hypothetical protein
MTLMIIENRSSSVIFASVARARWSAVGSPAPVTAVDVIHQCLTHGHYGWSLDLPHQQRLRDVMGIEIGNGTAQILKMIITRSRPAGRIVSPGAGAAPVPGRRAPV